MQNLPVLQGFILGPRRISEMPRCLVPDVLLKLGYTCVANMQQRLSFCISACTYLESNGLDNLT